MFGVSFFAITKNSQIAWVGDAKNSMVSMIPMICQSAQPLSSQRLPRYMPIPTNMVAIGP